MTNYADILTKKIEEMNNIRYKVERFQDVLTSLTSTRTCFEACQVNENGEIVRDDNGDVIHIGRKSEEDDYWDAYTWDAYTIAIRAIEKELEKLVK